MGRYRTGRRNGHTIYWQHGDTPSDRDRFAAAAISPEFATEIVRDANRGLGIPDPAPRASEESA